MKLAFIGYGELAKQIENLIVQHEGTSAKTIVFDDTTQSTFSHPFDAFLDDKFSDFEFIVSLGYKHLEKKAEIISALKAEGRKLKTFIHSTSYINPSAKVDDGVIIYPMCVLDQNVMIHSGSLLNNGVIISHDSTVGKASFLAPGVVINGNCKIGHSNFLGSGTIVSNDIETGKNVQVGIGSVVTQDLPENTCGIGNPFKVLENKLKLK